jgi:hypothetical protein
MPLTRGEIVGHDAGGMFYKFTMMNGIHTVDCEISNVALSDLAGGRWATLQIPDREATFDFGGWSLLVLSNSKDQFRLLPEVVNMCRDQLATHRKRS